MYFMWIEGGILKESIYKFIELVGTSTESWEAAASAAVAKAEKSLRDVRIAEVKELDMKVEDGKITAYRTKVKISFRVETIDEQTYHKDPASWFLEKERWNLGG
jgi:dodecin